MEAKNRFVVTVLMWMTLLTGSGLVWAEDPPGGRYALVIGNSLYGADPVSGVEDAKAMAKYLDQMGFTVLPPVLDAKLKKMRDGLDALKARISNASVVVVFYSGHGFRIQGENYLLPINGTTSPSGSLALTEISDLLAAAPKDAVKLVFLDACRDLKDLTSGASPGFAEIPDPPKQVLYAFAAGAGRTAASGPPDGKSPYAEALLEFIREPGLEIRDFLAKVHLKVASRSSQAPTEFGLSHLPQEFYLRPPVYVNAKIDGADDALVALLNGEVALQKSGDEEVKPKRLRLRARDNNLILLAFNGKSFHNRQSWERPEGWGYGFQIFPDGGQPLLCSEHTADERCFSGGEKVPFKAGAHHGRLFQVAKVNLYVDPATAKLSLVDRDSTVWKREPPIAERDQEVLYERKLLDMPLDRILGPGTRDVVALALSFIAPDPQQIFVSAWGNRLAKAAVQTCMADEETRIRDLKASIDLAIDHHPTPFDSFDLNLSRCVQKELEKTPNPEFPPKEIFIWTAVEDRHGDLPAPLVAVADLPNGLLAESPSEMANAEGILLEELAQQFSPIRPAQHQLAAVRAAQDQLQRLRTTLLYASVSAADLQAQLPDNLETRFKVLDVPGVARVARIELRDQEVVAWIAFELSRPEGTMRLSGEAEIHCAAAIERGALVLRPSVSTIHLTGANVSGRDLNLALAKPLLVQMLKRFLGNMEDALKVQRVPLRLDGIEPLDLANLLDGVGTLVDVNAKPVEIKVGLGAAALLVDAAGIHVLADAVVLTPARFAATLGELRQDLEMNRPPQLTSEQLAALGECGQPLPLPEPLAPVFASVCAAHAGLVRTEAPGPAETPEEAETALGSELEAFRSEFRDRVGEVEPIAAIPWDRTVFALSRSQLVAGLNEILPGVVVRATVRPPGIQAEIPPEDRTIRTPPASNLNCDRVGGACPSVFEFRPYNPRGCPSNCGIFDFGCHGWKIECEALKERERLAYEAEKAAAQAAFGAEKLRCEAVKAGQQLGCRANQEWLNAVANREVGQLRGALELREIDLPMTLDQVRLGADLDTIDLRLSASGGGEVFGRLNVTPLNLGHLACLKPWDATLKARVILPEQQRVLQLRRTEVGSTGDELLLTYELSETPLRIKVEPPPVKAFLEQNAGTLALSCPIPAAGFGAFPGTGLAFALPIRNEILRDTFDVNIPAREIPIVIPSQEIRISQTQAIRIFPSWGEKSILFEAR
jgi:hypothetical protein